jgi:hypothetical protein
MKGIRPFANEGLAKHGYSIQQVKTWRAEQYELGRPSTFQDFFSIHGLCPDCYGLGEVISGVFWIDSADVRNTFELIAPGVPETISSLYQRVLKSCKSWNYLYSTCEICGGNGMSQR